MEYFWLAVFGIFCVIEGATYQLVSIWFAVGSAAAMLSAVFRIGVFPQIGIFIVVSALMLIFTRPLVKRLTKGKLPVKTNADRIEGKRGTVISAVDNNNGGGQIKVGGEIWTAKSDSDEIIPVGETVEIDRIEGVKVIVKLVKQTALKD